MRQNLFFGALLLALVIAFLPLVFWSIGDCQPHTAMAGTAACATGWSHEKRVYLATLAVTVALAVGLYLARSRLAWPSLIIVAAGPWMTMGW